MRSTFEKKSLPSPSDVLSIRDNIARVVEALSERAPNGPDPSGVSSHYQLTTFMKRLKITMRPNTIPLQPSPSPRPQTASAADSAAIAELEDSLWKIFGMTGDMVPEALLKECQRRLSEANGHRFTATSSNADGVSADDTAYSKVLAECLDALDLIHRKRKEAAKLQASSVALLSSGQLLLPPKHTWAPLEKVSPSVFAESRRSDFGSRFWALIIGNNNYDRNLLNGCINDAILVKRHLEEYLGVPPDHILLLKNAKRQSMIDALYDLRDHSKIQRGDNILIHYSGHGTSYEPDVYSTTLGGTAGSIEAICPVDRGASVPDISDRELNSILNELRNEKGENITLFMDCCHSGGGARGFTAQDDDLTRCIAPLAFRIDDQESDLHSMLEAADTQPRRRKDTPPTYDEDWIGNVDGFVQLAACQDFQITREGVFEVEGKPSTLPPPSSYTSANEKTMESRLLAHFQQTRGLMSSNTKGKIDNFSNASTPSKTLRKQYGRFTWALINTLQSKIGQTGTYEDVIESIGQITEMQVPVALGLRKSSHLWFDN